MERKGECNLAVTQILHLHLYKTSSPVCLSGSLSLFLFPSFLSFSLPLSLSLSFPCAVAWGVVIFGMFSLHCALCVCVNCSHPWGKGERWVGPVWELPCQVLWYDSAWSCRHLVCLKGTRKARLLSLSSPSFCPPFTFYSTSLSFFPLSHFRTYSLCLRSPRTQRKQLLYSLHTGIPPYQPNLSHQSWHTAYPCLYECKCARKGETWNFVGQYLWKNLSRRPKAAVPALNVSEITTILPWPSSASLGWSELLKQGTVIINNYTYINMNKIMKVYNKMWFTLTI